MSNRIVHTLSDEELKCALDDTTQTTAAKKVARWASEVFDGHRFDSRDIKIDGKSYTVISEIM